MARAVWLNHVYRDTKKLDEGNMVRGASRQSNWDAQKQGNQKEEKSGRNSLGLQRRERAVKAENEGRGGIERTFTCFCE